MNFLRRNFVKLAILLILYLTPALSLAQPPTSTGGATGCSPDKEICNPITANNLPEFIKTILEGVIKIGIPVIALAIIYSGFLFVEARGNAEKINKAKKALLYTIIGAAILLGSWAIAKLISETVLAL